MLFRSSDMSLVRVQYGPPLMEILMLKVIDENYTVDSFGNVYSKPRCGTRGGILTPTLSKTGYYTVMLSPSRVPVKVHRLVASAFISNPNNLPYVNHIDGNKLNNSVDNLEWCTSSRNAKHAVALGLVVPPRNRSLLHDFKDEIRRRYTPNCRINGARALAKEFGVTHNVILRLIK